MLNDAFRIVTRCLKNTPVEKVYLLTCVASSPIRRLISSNLVRQKQKNDIRHPIYKKMATISQLKPSKCYLRVSCALVNDPSQSRINAWKDKTKDIRGWLVICETLTYRVRTTMACMEDIKSTKNRSWNI
jgi:hypothetical protein